jgi:hypothetical protein
MSDDAAAVAAALARFTAANDAADEHAKVALASRTYPAPYSPSP